MSREGGFSGSVRSWLVAAACGLWLGSVLLAVAQPTTSTKPRWLLPNEPLLTGIHPQRIQIVDINQDQFPDLAAISMEAVELWENDRLGGYQRVMTFEAPDRSLAVEPGDWDGDGILDFVVVGSSPGEGSDVNQPRGNLISVWLNRGNENYVRGAEFFFSGADVQHGFMNALSGDFNGDGLADLLVEGTVIRGNLQQPIRQNIRPAASASVFLGSGDGGFDQEFSVFENSADVFSMYQLGDLDGDGDEDLVRSVDLGSGRQAWLNSGDGRFESVEDSIGLPASLLMGVRRGNERRLYDADGDGDLDVAVPGRSSENYVFVNDGSGQFQSLVSEGFGRFASLLALYDLNRDGRTDFIGNGDASSFGYTAEEVYRSPVSIRLGNEGGGFDTLQTVSGGSPQDLVVSDLNGDEALDIVVLSEFGLEVWLQGSSVPAVESGMIPVAIENPDVRQRIGVTLAKNPDQITLADLGPIKVLDLSNLDMSTLTLPAGLTRLDTLNLDGNRLSALMLPSGVNDIQLITIRNNRSPVVKLEGRYPALQRLVLTGESVTELSIEADVPQLEDLSLWSTRIRNFQFLGKIDSLRILNLGGMELDTAVLPLDMPNLEQLSMGDNPLKELVVPRGFVVNRLIGPISPEFVYYDDAFIGAGQARISNVERGDASLSEITVSAGPGTYQLEFSNSLDTWEPVNEFTHQSVESTVHAIGFRETTNGYYRVSRIGP